MGDIISQHVGQHKYQVPHRMRRCMWVFYDWIWVSYISVIAQLLVIASQVVRSYCGHGIGDLFHCAPNIPHYAHNKVPCTVLFQLVAACMMGTGTCTLDV